MAQLISVLILVLMEDALVLIQDEATYKAAGTS